MTEEAPFDSIEVELRDGRRVRVREIRLDDRDEVRQAFDRLSSQSRYTRFMSAVRTLSPQMLERAVPSGEDRGLALVAEIDAADGIDIVGGARYYVEADGESCEFAVTVDDGWQGAGLAARLMRELIGAARARGLKRMEGFVLSENRRMLALARRLGFTARLDPGDATVTIVRLDLAASASTGRP
jgi:RimJ/RimL family protein N-acetyltransferase